MLRRKRHHTEVADRPPLTPRLTTAVVAAQVGTALDRFRSAVQEIEPMLDEVAEQQRRQQRDKPGV